MDVTTMVEEVRARLGETAPDFFTVASVLRALNNGQQRFCAAERWPWLYTEGSDDTLVADDETMTLPDDVSVNRVFGLVLAENSASTSRVYKLERLDPEAGWRARTESWGLSGPPRFYYVIQGETDSGAPRNYIVRFVPALDIAYEAFFTYLRTPAALVDASDEPDMPEEYHEAVVAHAAGTLFLNELAISQKASEQFLLYSEVLDQARREMRRPTTDEVVAWGREQPGERGSRSVPDWIRTMGPLG